MIAQEHDGGAFWVIKDFRGWWIVNMTPKQPDLYTRTSAVH